MLNLEEFNNFADMNFRTLFIGLCLLTLNSCSETSIEVNDPVFYKNPSFKIDGLYNVLSFVSEKPLDLNGDGVYSTDLLKEADQWENAEKYYFLQFITEQDYNDPTLFVPKLFLWTPYTGVITESGSGKFLYRDYSFANLLARCYYSENKNEIKIWNGSMGQGEILNAAVDGEVIVVDFIQSYYTANQSYYIESGWERLKIRATYKKKLSKPNRLFIPPLQNG